MNKPSFDDIIKNKINSLPQEPGLQGDWDLFKQKLDIEVNGGLENDIVFDSLVKTKIEHQTFTVPTTAWSRFLEYRFNNFDKSRSIVRIKIMEVAAILLLLLTFVQWFENKNIEAIPSKIDSNILMAQSSSEEVDEDNSNETNSPNTRGRFPKIGAHSKLFGQVSSGVTQQKIGLTIENPNTFISLISTISFGPIESLNNKGNGRGIFEDFVVLDRLYKTYHLPTFIDNDVLDYEVMSSIPNIEIAPIEPLIFEPLYTEFPLLLPMDIQLNDKKGIWAISGFLAKDFNLINTPFDKIYSLASYQKEFINNSYGIGISHKKGLVEYQADLVYSRRDYEPIRVEESFGAKDLYYFETSLDKISFNIMSASFLTKYHFINKRTWSSYLTTMASINLIMNADYDITENKILGRPSAERFVPEMPRLDQKPFNSGLIDDKSLAENYFISAGVGFGIEKSLTENVSLFLEASHQRHLFSADIGIGPNKDKIHTSSLKLGFKTWLN